MEGGGDKNLMAGRGGDSLLGGMSKFSSGGEGLPQYSPVRKTLLLLQSILPLSLVLAEKSKPCLQFSWPKFLLSSLVIQISLLKMKPFKKSTRLLANV